MSGAGHRWAIEVPAAGRAGYKRLAILITHAKEKELSAHTLGTARAHLC